VAFEWVKGQAAIAFRLPQADIATWSEVPGFFATPYGQGKWLSLAVNRRPNWKHIESLVLRSYKTVALNRMLDALKQAHDRGNM
jgi:hypothetical protein